MSTKRRAIAGGVGAVVLAIGLAIAASAQEPQPQPQNLTTAPFTSPTPSPSPENAEAVAKVADRIAELGEGGGFSGQKVDEDHRALTVYWKGTAPASVRRYAESSPHGVEVTIQAGVKYSKADLAKAVSRVFNDPMMRELNITFVGGEYDGTGISVGISGDSITGAQRARLSKVAGVDITGVEFNAEIDLLN